MTGHCDELPAPPPGNPGGHTRVRPWILAVGAAAVIAGHGLLYHVLPHGAWLVAVVSGAIGMVAIGHLGLPGSARLHVRRRSTRRHQGAPRNDGDE